MVKAKSSPRTAFERWRRKPKWEENPLEANPPCGFDSRPRHTFWGGSQSRRNFYQMRLVKVNE